MIVIGSTAIKHHFPDFNREPKDLDLITFEFTDYSRFKPLCEKVEYLKNKIISDRYYNKEEFEKDPFKQYIISPNDLLTLKVSHICWDIDCIKHLWDIQFLLKKGCKIDYELFKKLFEYWNTYYSTDIKKQ